jgi:hypothetical protein
MAVALPVAASRSGRQHAAFAGAALLIGAVAAAPVWLSPVLVTNDGPSHVYNAALAHDVRVGQPPFATYFHLQPSLRPNMANHVLLQALGPAVGWQIAERVLVTTAMLAMFVVVLALMRASDSTFPIFLVPLAGWLASNWFTWMGLYDFALSLSEYAALLLVLSRPLTPRRHLLVQVLLGLLYATHFFTFAAGIALVIAVVGWQALLRRGSWSRLGIALPAIGLLLVEMSTGGPGSGAVQWGERWDVLRALAIGQFVVSATPLDAAAGVAITASVVIVGGLRWRAARRDGAAALAGEEVFGFALVVLSLVAPAGVGEGTFIPIRMQCLGFLTLVPAVARAAGVLGTRLAVAGVVLLAVLSVHTAVLVRDAKRVDRDLVLIDHLLTAAGAGGGSWVMTRFTTYRRGMFHVAGYRHVIDRVAVQRGMVVLDNYEALYGVFPTVWRGIPDWIQFRPSTSGLTVRLAPGSIPWPGGVFVLHESQRGLQAADTRLALGPSAVGGPFAVTLVRRVDRRGDSAPPGPPAGPERLPGAP